MWNDRTKALIGDVGIKKLKESHVAIIGVGGVGGYVCLMLARAGVGNITLVDFDRVDETNINRQVVANVNTTGMLKTEVMKNMILSVNRDCKVEIFSERFCAKFAEKLFSKKFDYIVDAIDSVSDKVDLIVYCKQHGINIISAMGAGNRIDIPHFKVVDIYKTSNDGLAKIMRRKLRENQIDSLDVATSESPAIKNDENKNIIGSISYYPAMCGCVLSAYVVNKILN